MIHLFVPYELAVKLKEKGFSDRCLAYFSDGLINYTLAFQTDVTDKIILAPLYQQVIDWFRETHNLVINVYANASGYCFEFHDSAKRGGSHRYDSDMTGPNDSGCWDEYYDAKQASIEEAINHISNCPSPYNP